MFFQRTMAAYSRPLMPVFMGLCIGIALSLILVPLYEEQCQTSRSASSNVASQNLQQQSTNAMAFPNDDKLDVDYWNSDIFEPRRKNFEIKQPSKQEVTKILRPRYMSTELGIKEKLFVSVLSSKETLDVNGVAINKTLTHLVPKLVFFLNSRGSTLPSGMSMVIFSEDKLHLMPFHVFKYVADHYLTLYDWFYFAKDTTYIRGEKLMEIAGGMSIAHDVLMGRPMSANDQGQRMCDINSGILISQSVLRGMVKHLDFCIKNSAPGQSDSENIGQCLLHSLPVSCTPSFQKQNYFSYSSEEFHFNKDIGLLKFQPSFQQSVSVYKVTSDLDFYRLHRYFCEEELKVVQEKLERTKSEIIDVTPKTPAGNQSMSWPIGVDMPTVPRTRFDVRKWTYFTDTHLFLDSDFSNMKPLRGVDKEDVQDVIKVSMERLNHKHSGKYSFKSLLNGYRRFDAARGMDYIIDLVLVDKKSRSEVKKRAYLTRPLGDVEIIPMPYVTENSRVNLILPVVPDDRDSVMRFLESYGHTCLESGDNTHLLVVFIYSGDMADGKGEEDDVYAVHKSMVTFYENKFKNGAKIAWTSMTSNTPTVFNIMDVVSKKFAIDSLFLYCTVDMELSIEFMNRVRMNTIAQWQVYFPIGFQQFKPNLIYDKKPYPTSIEIKRGIGHFDYYSYAHGSFYNADYQYARKQMISTSTPHNIDLYDLFLKFHTVHVFRAVEPALKLRFRLRYCQPHESEADYSHCLSSRAEGLASRSQLAMLIFEYQQKLDQLQLNVMHQQNGQNVGQMKPDMLKK